MTNLYSRRCSFLIYGRLWSLFPTGKRAGADYSGFLVIGMIKWWQKSKPLKIPRASKKSHAEFPSHKHVQKALDDITRILEGGEGRYFSIFYK